MRVLFDNEKMIRTIRRISHEILERNTDRRGVFSSSRQGTRGHDDIFNFNAIK